MKLINPDALSHDERQFITGYVQAMLFTTNDESDESGGVPLDKNYDASHIILSTQAVMVADCLLFLDRYRELITEENLIRGRKDDEIFYIAGVDFLFTRNEHGAGFGDGHWVKEAEEAFSTGSQNFGEVWFSLTTDGTISQY